MTGTQKWEEELRKARMWKDEIAKREAEALRHLGRGTDAPTPPSGPLGDAKVRHDEEDAVAALYDRLSGAEVTRLAAEDPDKWQTMMAAVEQRGLRKLFKGSGR